MNSPSRTKRLVTFISRLLEKSASIGKTQIQKLVYFLQESRATCEYVYEIYHYGPYSAELSDELASLNGLGVLNIQADPSGYGFNITLGEFAKNYVDASCDDDNMRFVLKHFGRNTTSQLEVKSTIHFVSKILRSRGDSNKASTVKRVRDLKPRYTKEFVDECYDNLKELQVI